MNSRRKTGRIVKDTSVSLHFKELIDKVAKKQNLELKDLTEFYIIDLLSRFLLSSNLFKNENKKSIEEPLAIQLYKALEEKSTEQKISILKKMGDFALYISGFFSEHLGKKLVDLDYYINMGEGAYGAVSELSKGKPHRDVIVDVFHELSIKFKGIVDLLAEVSELSAISSDSDLLRVYEKWIKTKSPRLKKKLIEKGMLPVFRKISTESN